MTSKTIQTLKAALASTRYSEMYRRDVCAKAGLNYQSEVAYACLQLQTVHEKNMPEKIDPDAAYECIRSAGVLGLTLMPARGLAYILPQSGRYKLDPSYRGIIQMFYAASGGMTRLTVGVVRESDEWEQSYTQDGPVFKHVPSGNDADKIIRAYCYAKFANGEGFLEVMGEQDFKKVEAAAIKKAYGKTPFTYTNWQGEMWIKATIKRASKRWPMTIPETIEQGLFEEDIEDMVSGHEKAEEPPVEDLFITDEEMRAIFADVFTHYGDRGEQAYRSWCRQLAEKLGAQTITELRKDKLDELADLVSKRLAAVRGAGK